MSQDFVDVRSWADVADTADPSDCNKDFDALPALALAQENAEARASDTRESRAAHWLLIWCHERVLKPECEGQRQAIGAAAKAAEACLVCRKKAGKLTTVFSRTRTLPYVLLTDWREAKPCWQVLVTLPMHQRPAFMMIVAEQQSVYDRASRWVASLPPAAEAVHVCRDMSLLRAFLGSLALEGGRLGGGPARQSSAQTLRAVLQNVKTRRGSSKPQETVVEAFEVEVVQAAQQLPLEKAGTRRVALLEEELSEASTVDYLTPRKPADDDLFLERERAMDPGTSPTLVGAGIPLEPHRVCEQAADMERTCWKQRRAVIDLTLPTLHTLFSCHTPLQLEQMLRQAVPDHYDD